MKKMTILLVSLMVVSIGVLGGCTEQTASFINPPKAEVISENSRTGYEGLDYVIYVDATVYNRGGDGKVMVWASVSQGSNKWTKNQVIYLNDGETRSLTFTFKEVSFWDTSTGYYKVWVE